VLKLRSKRDNPYTFECKDLDTKESREFQFRMNGLLEAADRVFSVMKSPKDIFFLDLDNDGKWKVVIEKNETTVSIAFLLSADWAVVCV
jgi:hypothetical protein